MKQEIIIGTRNSKLALWQAEYVAAALRRRYDGLTVTLKHIVTKGDKILDVPLAKIGGKGLFTKELEREIADGTIDLAVHSLKDMPTALPEGLTLAVITKRGDSGDALVSPQYKTLDALPQGARVGTSSLRRTAQLLHVRPDLHITSLRGNVNTRLARLDEGKFEAIVLAEAGLRRLGLGGRITQSLPPSLCLPAVGQGALAIETRADNKELQEMLAFLHDRDTAYAAEAERSFLARVEGGCQVPVGVYAEITAEGQLAVEALIASLDGKRLYRRRQEGSPAEAAALGLSLAERLLDDGGRQILQELGLLTNTTGGVS